MLGPNILWATDIGSDFLEAHYNLPVLLYPTSTASLSPGFRDHFVGPKYEEFSLSKEPRKDLARRGRTQLPVVGAVVLKTCMNWKALEDLTLGPLLHL